MVAVVIHWQHARQYQRRRRRLTKRRRLLLISVVLLLLFSTSGYDCQMLFHCCCAFVPPFAPRAANSGKILVNQRHHPPLFRFQQQQQSLSSNNSRNGNSNNTDEEKEEDEEEQDRKMEEWLDHVSAPFRNGSIEDTQKTLVQKGIAFAKNVEDENNSNICVNDNSNYDIIAAAPIEKVPLCIANVQIQAILLGRRRHQQQPSSITATATATNKDEPEHEYYTVQLRGTADALLSRGLVAVLAEIMDAAGSTTHEVLLRWLDRQSPDTLADRLGLRSALSPGRNDGLASMVRTLKAQIRTLLLSLPSSSSLLSQDEPTSDKDEVAASNQQQLSDEYASNTAKDATTTVIDGTRNQRFQPNNQNSNDDDNNNRKNQNKNVALLLSGGVDSSVALHLLLRQGYKVTPFYLKIWLEDELAHLGECPWEDDYRTCQDVCAQASEAYGVSVPLESVSLQREYQQRVISYTTREASAGRTPNPDIMCNSRIKFGCFYDAIAARDFEFVATGHYAQLVPTSSDNNEKDGSGAGGVVPRSNRMRLLRAPDPVKDQSYFLCALTQDQLQRVLFPIGHLEKSRVRELAEEWQLVNRHRPDSQGLCFLGKVKFDAFLASYLGEKPGPILDASTGDVLGQHKGVWYHTVGQRKGIGKVLDPIATSKGPWYVVAKDPNRDTVLVSNKYDEDTFAAARSEFTVEHIHWIAGSAPDLSILPLMATSEGSDSDDDRHCRSGRLTMKIRHGPRLVEGTLTLFGGDGDNSDDEGDVQLDQKDGGLAPGQYVAFYLPDGECLGGGVISERHWAKFLLDRTTTSQNKDGSDNSSNGTEGCDLAVESSPPSLVTTSTASTAVNKNATAAVIGSM